MAGSRVTQTTDAPLILVILSVVVLMASVGKQGVMAQLSCTSALVSLSPCLKYISGNQTTPSQGCCSALASVVKNNAPCFCQLLTGNNSLGIPSNQTQALALPGKCNVTTPPVSQCQGSGAPTTSPSPTASTVPPTSSHSPAVSGAPTSSHSPAVSGAPTTSPSPTASASGIPPTSPSATGSGAPTTQATQSSNPTQDNSASTIFASLVLNVVTALILAAVVM